MKCKNCNVELKLIFRNKVHTTNFHNFKHGMYVVNSEYEHDLLTDVYICPSCHEIHEYATDESIKRFNL